MPTPMHRFMGGTRKLIQKHTSSESRDIPLSPQIRMARHTSSVLKSLKTQSDKITSKGELNSLQESRVGRKNHKIQL